MSYAPIYFSYPLPPISTSRTKKKFSASYLRNGTYIPRMKHLEVWLKIAPCDGTCRACGNPINESEVYGKHDMRGNYCRNCIVIPSWARHFEVTFSMKRGAAKKYTIVAPVTKIKRWARELRADGRTVTIKQLPLFDTGGRS